MKVPFGILGSLLLSVIPMQSQVLGYQARSSEEAEIVQIENEWAKAAIARDESRLTRIFSDDLIWNEDGAFRNKSQVLHRYLVEVQERVIELRNVRMEIKDDTAVVVSQIHVVKTVAGKTTESTHDAVDVFRKQKGRWQLAVEP